MTKQQAQEKNQGQVRNVRTNCENIHEIRPKRTTERESLMTAYIYEVPRFRESYLRFGQGWREQHRDGDDERGEALGAAVIVVLVGIEGGTFVLLHLHCPLSPFVCRHHMYLAPQDVRPVRAGGGGRGRGAQRHGDRGNESGGCAQPSYGSYQKLLNKCCCVQRLCSCHFQFIIILTGHQAK